MYYNSLTLYERKLVELIYKSISNCEYFAFSTAPRNVTARKMLGYAKVRMTS
jgi:hypothetical protein